MQLAKSFDLIKEFPKSPCKSTSELSLRQQAVGREGNDGSAWIQSSPLWSWTLDNNGIVEKTAKVREQQQPPAVVIVSGHLYPERLCVQPVHARKTENL
jgi:hypothetical protein